MKSKYITIICCMCILFCGCSTVKSNDTNLKQEPKNIITKTQDTKIGQTKVMEKEIKSYLQEDLQNVGISYYDLTTRESFSIHGDVAFRSASIAKLFVVMYAYEQIHANVISKDTLLYYDSNYDYEEGSGILQTEDLSLPIALDRLLEVAITHSDNIAYLMLLRNFGVQNIMQYYESIIGHTTPHDYIYMSAEDTRKLLLKIYSESTFDKMQHDLKNTIYSDRIAKYLPSETVAHKIGDFDSYVHDAAIIEGDKPFILIIFSNNLLNAYEKEARIAKIIYDIQTKK